MCVCVFCAFVGLYNKLYKMHIHVFFIYIINTCFKFHNFHCKTRSATHTSQIEEFTTALLYAEHAKQLFGTNARSLMMDQKGQKHVAAGVL